MERRRDGEEKAEVERRECDMPYLSLSSLGEGGREIRRDGEENAEVERRACALSSLGEGGR